MSEITSLCDHQLLRRFLTVAFDVYSADVSSAGCPEVKSSETDWPTWRMRKEPALTLVGRNTLSAPIHFRLWKHTDNEGDYYLSFRCAHTLESVQSHLAFVQDCVCSDSFPSAISDSSVAADVAETKLHLHRGFLHCYNTVRDELFSVLRSLPLQSLCTLSVTGHSLGGALAQLTAVDVSHCGEFNECRLFYCTFGAPPVGDQRFVDFFHSNVPQYIRFEALLDPIPCFLREGLQSTSTLSTMIYPFKHPGEACLLLTDAVVADEVVKSIIAAVTVPKSLDGIDLACCEMGLSLEAFNGLDCYIAGLEIALMSAGQSETCSHRARFVLQRGQLKLHSSQSDLAAEGAVQVEEGQDEYNSLPECELDLSKKTEDSPRGGKCSSVLLLSANLAFRLLDYVASKYPQHRLCSQPLFEKDPNKPDEADCCNEDAPMVMTDYYRIVAIDEYADLKLMQHEQQTVNTCSTFSKLRQEVAVFTSAVVDSNFKHYAIDLLAAVESAAHGLSSRLFSVSDADSEVFNDIIRGGKEVEKQINRTLHAIEHFQNSPPFLLCEAIIVVCSSCLAASSLRITAVTKLQALPSSEERDQRLMAHITDYATFIQTMRSRCAALASEWMLKFGLGCGPQLQRRLCNRCSDLFESSIVGSGGSFSVLLLQPALAARRGLIRAATEFLISARLESVAIETQRVDDTIANMPLMSLQMFTWFLDDGATALSCILCAYHSASAASAVTLDAWHIALMIATPPTAQIHGFNLFVGASSAMQLVAGLEALDRSANGILDGEVEFEDIGCYKYVASHFLSCSNGFDQSENGNIFLKLLRLLSVRGRIAFLQSIVQHRSVIEMSAAMRFIEAVVQKSNFRFGAGCLLGFSHCIDFEPVFIDKLHDVMTNSFDDLIADEVLLPLLLGFYCPCSAYSAVAAAISGVLITSAGPARTARFLSRLIEYRCARHPQAAMIQSNLTRLLLQLLPTLDSIIVSVVAVDVFNSAMLLTDFTWKGEFTFLQHCEEKVRCCLKACAAAGYLPASAVLAFTSRENSEVADKYAAVQAVLSREEYIEQEEAGKDSNFVLFSFVYAFVISISSALEERAVKLGFRKLQMAALNGTIESPLLQTALGRYWLLQQTSEAAADVDVKQKAVECFRISATSGHAKAQYLLGLVYLSAFSVEKDEIVGREYILKAATQGHLQALSLQSNLERDTVPSLISLLEEGAISYNIELLTTGAAVKKVQAARALRLMAVTDDSNRCIAAAGAVPLLVALLRDGSTAGKHQAAGALEAMAAVEENIRLIENAGGVAALVSFLQEDGADEKNLAARVLWSLSQVQETKRQIAVAGGIPPLVSLLRDGCAIGKENAAGALGNISSVDENKRLVAEAGGIPPLVALLTEGNTGGKEQATFALWNLAASNNGNHTIKQLITEAGGISPMVSLLCEGGAKEKENAAGLLWIMTARKQNKRLIADADAIPPLISLLREGSETARIHAAGALRSLVADDENKRLLAEANGIPPLIDLLRDGDTEGKDQAACAIRNLIAGDEYISLIADAGAIPPLLALLQDGDAVGREQAEHVLRRLATVEEYKQQITDAGGSLGSARGSFAFPQNKRCTIC